MIKRQLKRTELVVGNKYWIIDRETNFSRFRGPLLFIGYPDGKKKPWFTFGPTVEGWRKSFNYTASVGENKFYEEGAL